GSGGELDLLELSTPCTLQMVQLLQRFVRQGSQAWPCTAPVSSLPASSPVVAAAGAAAAVGRRDAPGSGGGGGGGGGVREVRLMLRLAANWTEVVAAAAVLSPALTSLALLPTYLYSSGTMMTPQIVSAVATSLPLLEHLELYRLNTDPGDVTCLADMPYLRFVLLGVAEEARERRGANHPANTVRALLAALHGKRRRGITSNGNGNGNGSRCPSHDIYEQSEPELLCGSGSGVRDNTVRGGGDDGGELLRAARGGGGEGGGGGGGRDTSEEGVGNKSSSPAGDGGAEGGSGAMGTCAARVGGGGTGGNVVVCCPELSEEEVERLDEMCEVEYGIYDLYGSRLRVERAVDQTLPWRLAVGSSMGPGRWRL
ncbi:hypothetical protein Vretifemale_7006, partial [Volvox reticuliferus]